MEHATVLILGGGVGGLVCANELSKRLDRRHRIVLMDREAYHTFSPSLLWLSVGTRKPSDFRRGLNVLERKGVEVVTAEIQRIDPERREVQAGGQEWSSEYLVVSLGAELAPHQVPGLPESGYNLYTLEGATAIRDARQQLRSGRTVVLVTRTPFKCPAAPYEETMLLEYDARKRKARGNMNFAIYTPEPGPMPVAGPAVSAGVRRLLEERGIAYFTQHTVQAVDPIKRCIHFANGAEAAYDFLIFIPPHIAPKVVQEAGLTGASGWVPVDKHTLETQYSQVYALGDVTGIPLAVGMPLPKAGVFAHGEAEVVAHNIALQLEGHHGQTTTFNGHGECFVEVGDGKASFGRGNFYAEPQPQVRLYGAGRHWHAAKVLFEKDWQRRWF